MTDRNIQGNNAKGLTSAMWLNWTVCYGALTLPLVLSLFMSLTWLPFVALAEVYVLSSLRRADILSAVSACSVLTGIVIRTLVVSALIMIVINVMCTDWLIPTVWRLRVYNSEIPFVVCLIVSPATAVFCALSRWCGLGVRSAHECQRRNGFYPGDSMAATIYYREARYQTTVLMCLSAVMGAVEYWYYFARYINANFNDPDRFFFIYMPMVIYLLSVLFLRARYESMGELCEALVKATGGRHQGTLVRYLIFKGDNMLLHESADGVWDTPAEGRVERKTAMGDHEARLLFTELTGLTEFGMRYCFSNKAFASDSNMIHYAVFVDSDTGIDLNDRKRWFNPYMLDSGLASNAFSPVLANELYRIHTITMAWKTYDREGRRLYPIKHYRPTFRLRDLKDWSVDYDDESWFDVAHSNEDRLFFRSRRLWDRLTGVLKPKSRNIG